MARVKCSPCPDQARRDIEARLRALANQDLRALDEFTAQLRDHLLRACHHLPAGSLKEVKLEYSGELRALRRTEQGWEQLALQPVPWRPHERPALSGWGAGTADTTGTADSRDTAVSSQRGAPGPGEQTVGCALLWPELDLGAARELLISACQGAAPRESLDSLGNEAGQTGTILTLSGAALLILSGVQWVTGHLTGIGDLIAGPTAAGLASALTLCGVLSSALSEQRRHQRDAQRTSVMELSSVFSFPSPNTELTLQISAVSMLAGADLYARWRYAVQRALPRSGMTAIHAQAVLTSVQQSLNMTPAQRVSHLASLSALRD